MLCKINYLEELVDDRCGTAPVCGNIAFAAAREAGREARELQFCRPREQLASEVILGTYHEIARVDRD